MKEDVTISTKDLIKAINELNIIVVSLDHIGSAMGAGDLKNPDYELRKFIEDWKICSKLAKLRRILSECLDKQLSKEDIEKVEETVFSKSKHWTFEDGNPPTE